MNSDESTPIVDKKMQMIHFLLQLNDQQWVQFMEEKFGSHRWSNEPQRTSREEEGIPPKKKRKSRKRRGNKKGQLAIAMAASEVNHQSQKKKFMGMTMKNLQMKEMERKMLNQGARTKMKSW